MKNLISVFTIISSLVFFISCQKDKNNPVDENSNSLDGTWKTNGIYVYINPNEGLQFTLEINNNNYSINDIRFIKDNNGSWYQDNIYNQSGTFSADNYFFILENEDGGILHYSIEGDKMTLSSTADHGGIFTGNSNELVGQNWKIRYSSSERTYFYNANGTGTFLYDYLDGSRIDTVFFNYTKTSNVITHNWTYIIINGQQYTYDSNPYIGVYEIEDNKLYMYGKAFTRDNDNYGMVELFKQ